MSNRSTDYKRPQPAVIKYGAYHFLITDRPTDFNIEDYIENLQSHKVVAVVRVCEPTYDKEPLESANIKVYDWEFEDGSFPPAETQHKWLSLIVETFRGKPDACIAVHCVAGLGRAPVLVAIALMEAGLKWEDAVDLIRRERKGAINQRQLGQLQKFKPSGHLKAGMKNGGAGGKKDCAIM